MLTIRLKLQGGPIWMMPLCLKSDAQRITLISRLISRGAIFKWTFQQTKKQNKTKLYDLFCFIQIYLVNHCNYSQSQFGTNYATVSLLCWYLHCLIKDRRSTDSKVMKRNNINFQTYYWFLICLMIFIMCALIRDISCQNIEWCICTMWSRACVIV